MNGEKNVVMILQIPNLKEADSLEAFRKNLLRIFDRLNMSTEPLTKVLRFGKKFNCLKPILKRNFMTWHLVLKRTTLNM